MTVDGAAPTTLSVRQAAFIGVGAMVGAGIFALLGAAGEVAGAAVWVSFLLAGAIAALQGYSFAKFGARYPSGAGLLEYVVRGFGNGHVTGVVGWLLLAANAIITAMVAVSFGSYADSAFADGDGDWTKAFAVLVVVVMSMLNILGSQVVARAQTIDRDRGDRHPHHLRRRHPGEHRSRPAGVLRLPVPARHRLQCRPDLLRVPRLRRHHVHGEGPRPARPGAASGRLPGPRHRDRRVRRGGAGRLRHPHGRRGGRLRRHRPRRGRRAGPRERRVLADERDRVVRDGGRDERGSLPGGRPVRADGVARASSRRCWGVGSATGHRPASWSPPWPRSSCRWGST